MSDPTDVSLIMPCFNEAEYLSAVLASINAQDFPHNRLELIFVDGGSTDASREIALQFQENTQMEFHLLDNPRGNIAKALNAGLSKASGDIVIRMDSHTTYAADYVSRCVHRLEAKDGEAVGGLQRGVGIGLWGKCIAIALDHPFASGGPQYKTATSPGLADTVYLGAWYRSTLLDLGGWSEDWDINEDYELCYRVRERGGRVFLDPQIQSTYFVRNSLKSLSTQYWRYGKWRVRTLVRHPKSGKPRYFVAPGLFIAIIMGCILIPFSSIPLFLISASYLIAALVASLLAAFQSRRPFLSLLLLLVFPILHFSWAFGFLAGVIQFGLPVRAGLLGLYNWLRPRKR
ncbi:MAG: glycosyltransferase family 2 protein [Anaerolineales bacterium]|jgi:glycosyltransferase involved in cell wall biosynthesis